MRILLTNCGSAAIDMRDRRVARFIVGSRTHPAILDQSARQRVIQM